MHVPVARERVEIIGRPGVFFVLSVDHEAKTAHLLSLNDPSPEAEDVPFDELRATYEDVLLRPGRA